MISREATHPGEVVQVLLLRRILVSGTEDATTGTLLLVAFSQAGHKEVRTNSWLAFFIMLGFFFLVY